MLDIRQDGTGVVIKVRVQPRASQNSLAGEMEGALKVRLTAPPVDGAANEACCKFFAQLFGVAKTNVTIISGHTGRNKLVRIEGVSEARARSVLRA
ncbi:DUF167 domain-containing protein [Desulforamulus putei]|uniref:UPF0235 protein SAMN02745133_00659 n=1 Tax=Desulforamulus putei DSM 12395 TaxID=1121429 RepID=A0A1M4UIX5_9FIRM|nr:DUF167 domain-containing protein [Desulforamulus putei]SHE56732.1 hypothetical protein SAMN02745133_00659 [Desulforamulus putei DSM 12395]